MRGRRAIPWLVNVDCCGHRVNFDQELEKYGTGVLNPKYEKALERFFKTKDKKVMLQKALRADRVPVWCEKCRTIEVVDVDSGDCVSGCSIRRGSMSNINQRVAEELIGLAKLLLSDGVQVSRGRGLGRGMRCGPQNGLGFRSGPQDGSGNNPNCPINKD